MVDVFGELSLKTPNLANIIEGLIVMALEY
jgi:hypothetical protein